MYERKHYVQSEPTVPPTRIALAHQWFAARRGGERTVEEIAKLFPGAPVATLVLNRGALGSDLPERVFHISPLGAVSPRWIDHRLLLPLFPWAVRRLRLDPGTELLISSDASLIKGISLPEGCRHVCYCHSPPRYLWDMAADYAERTSGMGPLHRMLFRALLGRLRRFDLQGAQRVDAFVANSTTVAERIQRTYGRTADVIHPPVDVERFSPSSEVGDYYLIVAELVSYKRVDLAVLACSCLGQKLIVVGDGPELQALRRIAGPTVEFRGRISDVEVARLMARCRAFLHPQFEDFGIAAVEAQAAGRPVVAFAAGGALETVVQDETGILFHEQSEAALAQALRLMEERLSAFDAAICRRNAERFSSERFRREFRAFLVDRGFC